jgi:RNA-binding protein
MPRSDECGTSSRIRGCGDLTPCVFFPAHLNKTDPTVNTRQRTELSSRAHKLKPLVWIGKEGVSDAAVNSVLDVMRKRDLIKVKVLEGAPADARDIGHELAGKIDGAEVVRTIGRMVILYRPISEE